MSIITLEGPQLDKEDKKRIVQGFTDVASNVMKNIPKKSFVVIIKENSDENIGVGGDMLTDLKSKQ